MWRFRRRTRAALHPLETSIVVFIAALLQLPGTEAQNCSLQPVISSADPPSASRTAVLTVLGQNLNVSSTINVTWLGDSVAVFLINVTEPQINFTVTIPPSPSTPGLATFALYPDEQGCQPVSIDIYIVVRLITVELIDGRQIVQPGSVLSTELNSCLPPDCGDNSTSYDVLLQGQTLEILGDTTGVGFTARIPPGLNSTNDEGANLMIQSLYSDLGTSATVDIRSAPPIANVTPSSGQRGTRVVITGENLLALEESATVDYKTVVIGSSEVVPEIRSNSTHIYVRVDSGQPGSTKVSINTTQTINGNRYNGPYIYSFSLWTQLEDGVVTEIIPPSAQVGSTVTLCGERLLGGGQNISSITIAGQRAQTSGSVVSPRGSLECTDIRVPNVSRPEDISSGGVTIESDTGAIVESNSSANFTYATITNVIPSEGQVGTEVNITGVGLLSGYPSLTPTVYLTGIQASLLSFSSERIRVRANSPEEAMQIGSGSSSILTNNVLIVVTRNGTNFTVSLENSWNYLEVGRIDMVNPQLGQYGTRITIIGTNLLGYGSSLRQVTVGGSSADIVSETNTEVVVDAPDISTIGHVDIVLESNSGALVSRSDTFEYRDRGEITSLMPPSGQNGTYVTIQGSNLFGHADNISNVTFGGVPAELDVSNSNSSHIRARVGVNNVTTNTAVSVVITAVTMARVVSSGNNWTYLVPGVVIDVEPNIGQNGTIVIITGTNLLGGGADVQTIFLDGVPAAAVNEATSTLINVSMSDLSERVEFYTGNVYIEADTGAVVVGGVYTHRPSGNITGFSPVIGQEGTRIVINGNNLPGYGSRVTEVYIAGIRGRIVEQVSESQVVVRAGAASSGTSGSVVLISDTGAIVSSSDTLVFNYTQQGSIESVIPSQGAEGSGVEIRGTSLRPPGTSITSVTIGGSPVLRIVTQSDTELSVIAGAAPISGGTNAEVMITASDGSIVQGGNFTYLNLTLSLPNLNHGQQGTRVAINLPDDEAFNSDRPIVAEIGDSTAEIVSSSGQSIEVIVPRAGEVGSHDVDVAVEGVDGRVARLRNGFTYVQEGVVYTVTPSEGQLGTRVVVAGRNLLGGGSYIQYAQIGQRGVTEVRANVTDSDNETVILEVIENLPPTTQFPVRGDLTLVADTGATTIAVGLFDLVQPGVITNVSPTIGQFGTRVNISGTNLLQGGMRENISSITLSGIEVLEILDTPTDSEIRIRANSSSVGSTGSVIITLTTGAQIITPGTITFQYLPPGVINSIMPAVGTVGTRVTISGENLLAGGMLDEVRLGGQPAIIDQTPSDSRIIVRARALRTGTNASGIVELFISTGAVVRGDNMWTYEELGSIETITPSVGQQGVIVQIRGTSLLGSSAGSFINCSLAGTSGSVRLSTQTEARCEAGFNPFATNYTNPERLSGPVELVADSGPILVSRENFTYYVTRIERVDPINGTNGTFVNITGSNLITPGDSINTITFGNIEVISSEVLTEDSIRVRVNASSSAMSGQTVRINLQSGIFLELDNAWDYTEPGEIVRLSPSSARPGESVTIYGTRLVPPCVSEVIVIVGQTQSYQADIINSSAISFRPGPYQEDISSTDNLDTPGVPLPVQVIASNGATVYNSSGIFTYNESIARVANIMPPAGINGTLVNITGTNLLFNSTVVAVSLAGVNATVINSSDTEIIVIAGNGPINGGSGRLLIESAGGLVSGIGTNVWQYLPIITADDVTPRSGQNGTRVFIDLKGLNLTITNVYLAGVRAMLGSDPGSVIAAPSTRTPLDQIRIEFENGVSITIPSSWQYLETPRIDRLSPSTGYYNTTVRIEGGNLRSNGRLIESVFLAGLSTEIVSQTNDDIVTRVSEFHNSSSNSITGEVTIIWQDGAVLTQSSLEFTYVRFEVSEVSPNSGQRGTRVVITGIGLLAGSSTNQSFLQFQLGGIEVQNITEISDTRISFLAPDSREETTNENITYIVADGGSVVLENVWSYLEPGVVTEVSPRYGVQGSYVTIRGERMLQGGTGVSEVSIAGVEVLDIVAGYDDLIQVRLGVTSSLRPGEIIITSNTGATLFSNLITFQYQQSGTITAVSPDSGQNGTRVTITGSGFIEFGVVAMVTLAGIRVNEIESVTNTTIVVEAGRPDTFDEFSGDVTIETELGVVITGDERFTYNREGVVYFGTPAQGRGGTQTIISGERLTGGGTRVQRVFLAGIEVLDVITLNESLISVTAGSRTIPGNSTGDIVLVSDTGAYVRKIDGWTYVTEGVVIAVEPPQGQYGTRVNISGTGLLSGGDSVGQVTVRNVSSYEVLFSSDTRVEVRMGESTSNESFTAPITLISNYGGELRSLAQWMYLEPSRITSYSPTSGVGGDVLTIEGERLLGGGSSIVSVLTAGVQAINISDSNNSSVTVTVGYEPNGDAINGDIIIESDTGALTIISNGWRYNRACPDGQYGTFGNCSNCNDQCTRCNGPSNDDCFECENFLIPLSARITVRCVDRCPNVSTMENVCMDTCRPDQYSRVDSDRNAIFCYNCSEQCDERLSCSGPGPSDCGGCRNVFDQQSQSCVESCVTGTWQSPNNECIPCHSQCNTSRGCFGPNSTDCYQCINVSMSIDQEGSAMTGATDICIERCPSRFYVNNRRCLPCSDQCQGGCTGRRPFDCFECASFSREQDNNQQYCVPTCNDGLGQRTLYDSSNGTCGICSSLCSPEDGCIGPNDSDCVTCRYSIITNTSLPRFNGECVSQCPNTSLVTDTSAPDQFYYHNFNTGNCELCDSSCENGCTGPGPQDCRGIGGEEENPFSAGRGTIIVSVVVTGLLGIALALVLTGILIALLKKRRGYKLGHIEEDGVVAGGGRGGVEMSARYAPRGTTFKNPLKESATVSADDEYTQMAPTDSVASTLKRASLQREQAEVQLKEQKRQSRLRTSMIKETEDEVTMIENDDAEMYIDPVDAPNVPPRPTKPEPTAPTKPPAISPETKPTEDKQKAKDRKSSDDRKSTAGLPPPITPYKAPLKKSTSNASIPERKPAAPLPPAGETEGEMYTEMSSGVQEVYMGPEEEYSEMSPVHEVEELVYEDTVSSPPISPQKTSSDTTPLIDESLYEDTEDTVASPSYQKVKHSMSAVSLPVQPAAPSITPGPKPIPRSRSATPLPQTPLEASLHGVKHAPAMEDLYEETEAGKPEEESLYEAIGLQTRPLPDEPSPEITPKARGRRDSTNPPLPPKGRK